MKGNTEIKVINALFETNRRVVSMTMNIINENSKQGALINVLTVHY